MKIAIVRTIGYVTDTDSYNVQELGLAKALAAKGNDVEVFLAGNVNVVQKTVLQNADKNSLVLYLIPYWKLPGWQCYMPDLKKLLKSDYDLIQIHEYGFLMSYFTAGYADKNNVPLVLCQGMYKRYDRLLPRILHFCFNRIFLGRIKQVVKASLAKTEYAAVHLKQMGFSNINICPVGLDVEPFCQSEIGFSRHKLNIPDNARVLLYVGILEERRGISFLIELLKFLVSYDKSYYLVIIGKARESEYQLLFDSMISGIANIRYISFVEQTRISEIYKLADIFLLHSYYEIYGMVILEAMYFGLPVLATETAGSGQIIENGENGYILPSDNVEIWVSVINELFANPEKKDYIGNRASNMFREKYVWEKAVDKYLAVYEKVLSK